MFRIEYTGSSKLDGLTTVQLNGWNKPENKPTQISISTKTAKKHLPGKGWVLLFLQSCHKNSTTTYVLYIKYHCLAIWQFTQTAFKHLKENKPLALSCYRHLCGHCKHLIRRSILSRNEQSSKPWGLIPLRCRLVHQDLQGLWNKHNGCSKLRKLPDDVEMCTPKLDPK